MKQSEIVTRPGGCPYKTFDATDHGFENYLQLMFQKEKEFRSESDEAARMFIKSNQWPAQSPWAEYVSYLRVQCAFEFACQLTTNDFSKMLLPVPQFASDETIWTWFLIDHWDRCFDVWLKLVAQSIFFELPLYGLTPATP